MYTDRSSDWILKIDDKYIQPFVIQRWLMMNNNLSVEVRWLDSYIFHLSPKQYLSLAWSCIPKVDKTPFIKYIKKPKKSPDKFLFIIDKIRNYFKMDDNNWRYNEESIRNMLETSPAPWFKFFGIRKYYWKKFNIDYDYMKGENKNEKM